jgi:hypothetical protein
MQDQYLQILTAILVLVSEVLPFLESNGNGILHTLIHLSRSDCFTDKLNGRSSEEPEL